VTPCIR